ncbi:MFS transporter [Leucobacter sp. CSA2]|uniref:Multidrug efflux pump Tap n=1 Tax=Leucobacter edaphi TaxID=2796472 RepID=A0A934QET5_9MICO|nr:MFS transporter [Leucobacter edaphi]MBK0421867.1 MFS transporter [Leucobacter edaphi]
MSLPPSRRRAPLVALLAGDGCSRAGNAVTVVAIPLLALQLDPSPWSVTIAGVAATAPIVIGGTMGGVLVDRFGFRSASIVADAASGITVLAIPVLAAAGLLPIWVLLLLVFASNLLDAPGNAARLSQLPELAALAGVPLEKAAAAQATVSRTAAMLGVSAAGVVVAFASAAGALLLTAGAFCCAILLTVRCIPRSDAPASTGPRSSNREGMLAGFAFIWRTPLFRAVVMMVVLTNAIDIAGATVLRPLYADRTGDPSVLGLMAACIAGGGLVGAAASGLLGDRVPRRPLFLVLFVLAGAPPYVILACEPPLPVALGALAIAGLAGGPLNPLIDSAILHLVPPGIRARVLAAISACVTSAMPLGSFFAGAAVGGFGLDGAMLAAAALYIAVLAATGFGARWREF